MFINSDFFRSVTWMMYCICIAVLLFSGMLVTAIIECPDILTKVLYYSAATICLIIVFSLIIAFIRMIISFIHTEEESMATILIVDDERNMRLLTAARLDGQYNVITASDGKEALDIIHKGNIDLVIADIMMPVMDGYDLLKTLRNEGYKMPFLFLTAKESLGDKERGFSLGTDDYITKPFSSDELLWRVKALLRRANIAESKKIRLGKLTVDSEKYAVYSDSEYIEFPKKEFDLLFKLLSYPGQIFSKEQLMESIWGHDSPSGDDTIKTHISRIRNRLSGIREFSIITIKGLGYKAVIDEEAIK